MSTNDDTVHAEYGDDAIVHVNWDGYTVCATIIFIIVAYTFLFPCNALIPLDRRTVAIVGSVLIYLTRTFAFNGNRSMDMLDAIDFDVLILLSSIMVVNHVVVHLKETRKAVSMLQSIVQEHPRKGFWMVSFCAFLASPFLTNDGVCLLFVEPILHAFDSTLNSRKIAQPTHDKQQDAIDSTADKEEMSAGSVFTPSTPFNSPHKASLINTSRFEGGAAASKDKTYNHVATHEDAGDNLDSKAAERTCKGDDLTHDTNSANIMLQKGDAIYFLLALACSSNIGSALTYTGNPQNMIVSTDAAGVLPPYKFLLYMLMPSIVSWLMTIAWIERCWFKQRAKTSNVSPDDSPTVDTGLMENEHDAGLEMLRVEEGGRRTDVVHEAHSNSTSDRGYNFENLSQNIQPAVFSPNTAVYRSRKTSNTAHQEQEQHQHEPAVCTTNTGEMNKAPESRVHHIVTSPIPYAVFVLVAAMIIMMFVDLMPISTLVCISAIVIVIFVVVGNHWMNEAIWSERVVEEPSSMKVQSPMHLSAATNNHGSASTMMAGSDTTLGQFEAPESAAEAVANPSTLPCEDDNKKLACAGNNRTSIKLSKEEQQRSLNEFFEGLFNSIDYSLLLIFLGTFIVVENMASTGIPKAMWSAIVGRKPFKTALSIFGISLFVVVTSQCLGNVAVIQLAKPNVQGLDDNSKRLAWAVLSFVATVGGNLTITGSAANIIVAEKARRLDVSMDIDFWKHAHVCFWITVLSCAVGAVLVVVAASIDAAMLGA